MLEGFEKQTMPLTDEEQNTLVPIFVRCLAGQRGKENAVTNKEICSKMCNYKMSDARVRKIINHIRINDLVPCLIATSNGYYVAVTEQEISEYCLSLEGRENAIREVRLSIERQRKMRYSHRIDNIGQLSFI